MKLRKLLFHVNRSILSSLHFIFITGIHLKIFKLELSNISNIFELRVQFSWEYDHRLTIWRWNSGEDIFKTYVLFHRRLHLKAHFHYTVIIYFDRLQFFRFMFLCTGFFFLFVKIKRDIFNSFSVVDQYQVDLNAHSGVLVIMRLCLLLV